MLLPTLLVRFFQTSSNAEPVRDWLLELSVFDRKLIGEDLKTVQYGWPLGMPLVRKMAAHLWGVRISLPNRIARVLFTLHEGQMVLLHGFIKKSAQTPQDDLKLATARLKQFRSML